MTSLRHNSAGRTPRDDYLDAARDCILDIGWRRTTLTEVARRAGVSRMTIYRAWSDMSQLLGDLMTREWTSIVVATRETAATTATVEGLGDVAVATVHALRANELFVRIVELDPELLLPYLLARRGLSQQALVELLAAEIRAGQAAGEMRAGDASVMARALVLAAHGFVLSAHTMVDDEVALEALDEELRVLVSRAVAP